MKDFKPGDKITILVGGKPYETYIDDEGVQRFPMNEVIDYLWREGKISMNDLAIAYQDGKFSREDYMHFYMDLGYSVCGFCEISFFEDFDVLNPLWID